MTNETPERNLARSRAAAAAHRTLRLAYPEEYRAAYKDSLVTEFERFGLYTGEKATPEPLTTYYVTFGQKYRQEPHPTLGKLSYLPDGYFTLRAPDYRRARRIAIEYLGLNWSGIYELTREARIEAMKYFPLGELGTLGEESRLEGKRE